MIPEDSALVAVDTDPDLTRQISLAHLASKTLPPIAEDFAAYLTEQWASR